MDCILDYESYQSLKQNYEQILDCNRVLESENETLFNSNKLLKRLLIALENIKISLEQKILIIQSHSAVKYTEQLVPFDRELQRLDEDYCQLKCELNLLEFEEINDEEEDEVVVKQDTNCEPKTPQEEQIVDDSSENSGADENKISAEEYSAANRLVSQLDGHELDENCVQYVVHHLLPPTDQSATHILDSGCEGQPNDESTADYLSCLSANTLNCSSTSEEPTPKRGRTKKPKVPGVKRFKCSWEGCEYATDSSGNYQKHYRIHTGEKPYKCDYSGCEYSCSDPGSIKEHKRIHLSEKQYSCDWPGCSWKFSTYKLLKNHIKACHTLEKPHKCDWPGCEKSFLAPYALRTHKLKHTGERPNKCDVDGCKAAFTRSTDLARHKRETHCSERQYMCEHENCGSKFYRKDDLRHHIRRKHDCPQFGRRRPKAEPKLELTNMEKLAKKYKKLGQTGVGAKGAVAEDIEEPKVVIDLNVAKVNQLRKSIQINFVSEHPLLINPIG